MFFYLILINFIIVVLKIFFLLSLVILVRVLVPRFKFESLSKIGWLYSILLVSVLFIIFIIIYIVI